jgi:competence protein ComEC
VKEKSKKLPLKRVLSLAILTALVVVLVALIALADWQKIYGCVGIYPKSVDGISVSYVDVGQGDCTYISLENHGILIDSGPDLNAEKLTQFLDRNSVKEIDAIIATHPDEDHTGGMKTIVNNYKVDSVFIADIQDEYVDNYNYKDFLSTVKSKAIPCYTVNKSGFESEYLAEIFSSKVRFDFLTTDYEYGDTNSDSVVVKLTYGDVRFLFTGDMSSKTEAKLLSGNLDLSADVLKVSHHGSRTATTEEFLNAVNPKIAVVTVGENSYNLPNIEVMKRLEAFDCKIYRTDENGTVTLTSLGEKITIHTEK